jgi:hypothetical protein
MTVSFLRMEATIAWAMERRVAYGWTRRSSWYDGRARRVRTVRYELMGERRRERRFWIVAGWCKSGLSEYSCTLARAKLSTWSTYSSLSG